MKSFKLCVDNFHGGLHLYTSFGDLGQILWSQQHRKGDTQKLCFLGKLFFFELCMLVTYMEYVLWTWCFLSNFDVLTYIFKRDKRHLCGFDQKPGCSQFFRCLLSKIMMITSIKLYSFNFILIWVTLARVKATGEVVFLKCFPLNASQAFTPLGFVTYAFCSVGLLWYIWFFSYWCFCGE